MNRLGLRDAAALFDAEAQIAAARDLELVTSPEPGSFDLAHLRRIHRRLFGDLYDWAGEVRTVDIGKGAPFAHWPFIAEEAVRIFGELAAEDWLHGLERTDFVDRLSYFLGEVNALHPFREGNGRAQRAFFRQLAAESGWHLDWARVTPDENARVSYQSLAGNDRLLRDLVERLVVTLED